MSMNDFAVVCSQSLNKTQQINAVHAGGNQPPLVFLSSFDASCLEFRLLLLLLEEPGAEAWAVDLVGWGLTEAGIVPGSKQVIGAAERRQHLLEFCKQKVCIVHSDCCMNVVHSNVAAQRGSFLHVLCLDQSSAMVGSHQSSNCLGLKVPVLQLWGYLALGSTVGIKLRGAKHSAFAIQGCDTSVCAA